MSEDRGDLAAFLQQCDEESFRRLYRRCAPQMLGLASRLVTRTEAADAVQEAWLRVVRDLERFEGRSRFETWVLGYVVRCCREVWRRRGLDAARSASLEPAIAELVTASPTTGLSRERRLDLEHALRALAPGYRSVLLLHDLYGLTHGEIAEMLEISAGTAKSQLSRARASMRRALERAPQ